MKSRFSRPSAAARFQLEPRSRRISIALVRKPIETSEIVAQLKAPPDGAVVVFEGIVRNHSGDRSTLYLEYEAYEAMAMAKMREIGDQMREKFSIRRFAMIHRLGRLEIGETSVLIVVCSAHRAAAFDACRFGIDTLKRTVPDLEEGILPRRRRLGRRRNPFRISNPFRRRNESILCADEFCRPVTPSHAFRRLR